MKLGARLDDLVAENPSPVTSFANDIDGKSEGVGSKPGRLRLGALSTNNGLTVVDKHIDVHEEEGGITILCKELPDGWSEESEVLPYRSLDRPFVFPGEQVHILACLSACKKDIETITLCNVAEVKSKNVIGQSTRNQSGEIEHEPIHIPEVESSKNAQNIDQNTNDLPGQKIMHTDNDAGDPALRIEEYKRRTQEMLKRFKNSHFFARIAEIDEALWSRRTTAETFRGSTATVGGNFHAMESNNDFNKTPPLNEPVDRGNLDASTSGGAAKNDVKCSLLANGDIVVLLQVNIGVDCLRDPVLEILQFEKHQSMIFTSGCLENVDHSKVDPYGDLLKWLLPVQNSVSQPRFLSPLEMSPNSIARSSLTKPSTPNSFGSQNFLLGHLRSHSMSSISSKSVPPTLSISSSRPNVDLDDWDNFSSSNVRSVEGLLSFRGVPLEPERFSVRCGLEGIYVPGRRWRKKIEIIQPLEIHCFAVDCNTKDYLCVQIKNVSPAHAPDIVIYLDAITVIFEESSKSGPHLSLPFTCVEAGNDHVLPDLALRKGEEHSFILKPQTSLCSCNALGESSILSQLQAGSAQSSVYSFSNVDNGASPANRYAILVSCRSNYTESRLFFKQPTNWRPHIQKDLLISVASQMSTQTLGPDGSIPHLPVQVLTLQASNLTNEDLMLTLLAPASLASSLVSLNYSPASPVSPFDGQASGVMQGIALQRLCSASKVLDQRCGVDSEQAIAISNVLRGNDLGRTHLLLNSRVPLGCVPSRSTITVKLELLPLSDGIITLDSLQINVERGLSYVPEHPLKINATSSIFPGVV